MQVKIRKWHRNDALALAQQANNPKIAENLRDGFPYPYTEEDAVFFINIALRTHSDKAWLRAIEIDGEVAGGISLTFGDDVYSRSAELGYWIGEEYWNRGAATEAVAQICREAFEQTEIVRIQAEVVCNNPASIRVLQKNNFQREGYFCNRIFKNGRLLDSVIFATFR